MEKKKRKFFIWCLIFLITNLVLGFVLGIYLVVRNHQTALLHSNCELPCWQGIIVGETSPAEVVHSFEDLPFVKFYLTPANPEDYKDLEEIYFYLYLDFTQIPSGYGRVNFLDDAVTNIFVGGNIGLNVEQVIKEFGKPEFVYVGREDRLIIFHMFYPQVGMVFRVDLQYTNPEIKGSSRIYGFEVIEPNKFQAYVNEDDFYQISEIHDSPFQLWTDYGKLKEKYWFPYEN